MYIQDRKVSLQQSHQPSSTAVVPIHIRSRTAKSENQGANFTFFLNLKNQNTGASGGIMVGRQEKEGYRWLGHQPLKHKN